MFPYAEAYITATVASSTCFSFACVHYMVCPPPTHTLPQLSVEEGMCTLNTMDRFNNSYLYISFPNKCRLRGSGSKSFHILGETYQEVSQLLLSPFTTSNKVEDSTRAIPNMLIQKDSYSPHGTLEEVLLERSAQWDHAGGKLLQSLEHLLVQ